MNVQPLDTDILLTLSAEAAGSHDFDDDGSLRSRLEVLVSHLIERLRNDRDRLAAAEVIVGLLTTRLQVVEAHRRLRTPSTVERPIIATGEARSGTTVLQMLLAQDPHGRAPRFWEVMRPAPTASADRRAALGDEDWREILEQVPRWLTSHPYNAMLGNNPPECERFWAIDFRAMPPSAWWRVPIGPDLPVLPPDHTEQYRIHRMMLDVLQNDGADGRHWVLKGTSHHRRLPSLLEAYPDAIVVWIHRDPLQAIASRFELLAQIYEGIVGEIDRPAFAANTVETSTAAFLAAASDPCVADPRVHHLRFPDFISDPIGSIRRLYEIASLPYSDDHEQRMRAWLDTNPSDRHGTFTYSADALGVDLDELDHRLEPYRVRFGLT